MSIRAFTLAVVAALAAAPALAQNVTLDITAIQGTASAGDSSVGSLNRPIVTVLARDYRGNPATTLTGSGRQGDDTSAISIAGWSFATLAVGPGGCVVKPSSVNNRGNGTYTLGLTTEATSGPCDWRPGDYVFSIDVDANGFTGIGVGTFPID